MNLTSSSFYDPWSPSRFDFVGEIIDDLGTPVNVSESSQALCRSGRARARRWWIRLPKSKYRLKGDSNEAMKMGGWNQMRKVEWDTRI